MLIFALSFSVISYADETEEASIHIAFVQIPKSSDVPVSGDIGNTILASTYLQGTQVITAQLDNIAQTMRAACENFIFATDPAFSNDGKRLIFAGKKSPDDFVQVWELVGESTNATQIVTCDADCIEPIYMPNGHVVFASLLSREYEEHGGHYSFSLYEQTQSDQHPTRITFNPSSDFDPAVLQDGRIVYSSWQHVGNHYWPRGTMALMLINSDGTGIFPLTGNHRGSWAKHSVTPISNSRVVFIQSEQLQDFGAGDLVLTDMNDSFAPYTTLIDSTEYQVQSVAPLQGGKLLLSARPTDGSRPTFGLYVLVGQTMKLLFDDPRFHEISPTVGAPIKRQQLRISTVVPGTPYGYVLVLNCYETDRTDQHTLHDGGIKTVRLIEGLPLQHQNQEELVFNSVAGHEEEPLISPSSKTGYIPSRILGEVEPAADGSIYLKVPADRPLRLQLVDQAGFTIMNERSWFWVRPNERRVCIGCHENRELSPLNVTPIAAGQEPNDLTDPSRWQTVSFLRDITPIISENCAVTYCHVPPIPTAGMDLTTDQFDVSNKTIPINHFNQAYTSLLERQEGKPYSIGGRRVHPGDSRQSPMLWMLYGRVLAKQYYPAPFERPILEPHPGPMLEQPLLELICKWIDLGAQYDFESSTHSLSHVTHLEDEMEEDQDVE